MRWTAETKVGIVVLLAMAALSYMTFQIGGFRFGDEGYRLFVVVPDAAGLSERAPVQIAGVDVGEVEQIALVEGGSGGVQITLRIRAGVAIKAGGTAVILSSGLLGDRFIGLRPGTQKTILRDGDRVRAASSGVSMDRLANDAAGLIQQFSEVAENIRVITASLRDILGTDTGKQDMQDIITHVKSLTEGVDLFVSENRTTLGRSITNLQEFSVVLKKEVEGLLTRLTHITQQIESRKGTVGKLIYDEAVYHKLESTLDILSQSLKDVQGITGKIERGEGTLGKLVSDETAYQNLNSALEKASNTLGRIERFHTEIDVKGEYQLDENEKKGYVSIRLFPNEDKYYLLEIVDDPRGEVALTSRLTTTDGVPSTRMELETKRKLKVSALFGRRFPHFGLRAGLMENAFGMGADFYWGNNPLRLSLDAWDFSSDDPLTESPHLKFSVRYDPWRNVYLTAGLDQILNDDTPFVGAGLRFEDDDLKYLLGVASLGR